MSWYRMRVIVIGGGMSGLACAKELQQRGYQVLVVEARSRVGGRLKGGELHSGDTPPCQVDLGGALIHGIDDNPLTSLARDIGVGVQPVADCLLLDNSGWPVDPREDEKVSTVFNDCLDECFQRCRADDNGTSFGDLFQKVCEERHISPSALLRWHKANLEISCGAEFERLGWRWNEDEPYGFDGEHVAMKPSWKAVVETLAEGLDILYDAPITRIHVVPAAPSSAPRSPPPAPPPPPPKRTRVKTVVEFDAHIPERQSRRLRGQDAAARRSPRSTKGQPMARFTVDTAPAPVIKRPSSETASGPLRPRKSVVQVTLENGNVLEADHVVCTLPLGILQQSTVVFDPPLPKRKRQAIQRLGAGLLNKCALAFPRAFWQDSDFLGLADERHSYLVLNAHAYTGQPILLFMYGGAFAKEIEDWTDAEIVEDCLAVLKRICSRSIPRPVDYRVTRWGHEQYSRMAFTYVPPGVDGMAELQAMSEPIVDPVSNTPKLLFAGEHTTPFHPSTIHGAFLSGIREAYRLDLTVDPEKNDNMVFNDQELYQRTFEVERRYLDAANDTPKPETKPAPAKAPPAKRQHRRRGASSVMKLRKRSMSDPKSPPRANGLGAAAAVASRKSPRAPVVTNGEASDAEEDDFDATVLENDTLVRSMESYGRDWGYLQNTVVPVYGTTSTWSLTDVKRRCQSLVAVWKQRRAVSSGAWKKWTARVVFPPTAVEAGFQGGGGGDSRSSRNARKRSAPRDDELIVEHEEVTTRSGRSVIKPSPLAPTGLESSSMDGRNVVKIVRRRRTPVVKTRTGRAVKKPDAFAPSAS